MKNKEMRLFKESIKKNILPLTSRCNFDCLFCSHKFNPPGIESVGMQDLDPAFLKEFLPLIEPSKPLVIGESITRLNEGEPLLHSDFKDIVSLIRRKYPKLKIKITTNGSVLDQKKLNFLKGCQPLEVTVSVNIVSHKYREMILQDKNSERTVKNIERLLESNLPCNGSMVALPDFMGWDELEKTAAFMDTSGFNYVRVFLPGYTRYAPLSYRRKIPSWKKLDSIIQNWKEKFKMPFVLEPPYIRDLTPEIEGVIFRSPMWKAGFKSGDLVDEVEGEKMRTRAEAYHKIKESISFQIPFSIKIRRNGCEKNIFVKGKELKKCSQFVGEAGGMIFSYDIDPMNLKFLDKFLGKKRTGLVLSSKPAVILLNKYKKRYLSSGVKKRVEFKAANNIFFGGNIMSAGLLTVNDFSVLLSSGIGDRFDYIFLPEAAFDERGRDIRGDAVNELDKFGDLRLVP